MFRISHLNTAQIMRAPDGDGSPPSAAPPAAPPTNVSAPPWGSDINATWSVGDKPWYDHLPEGPTRALFQEKRYANPAVAADAYYSANRMINANAVEVPAADAPPEKVREYYTKRGALDSADKYDLKMADGVQADEKLLSFGKKAAYELGLAPKEAQRMADLWIECAAGNNKDVAAREAAAQAETNKTELAGIKTKWGDKFDTNLAAGQRATKALYDTSKPEDVAAMQKLEAQIGGAAMLDLMVRIGSKSGEGSFTTGNAGGGSDAVDNMTLPQVEMAIAVMQNDPAYNTRTDPGHAAAMEKMNKLYARRANASQKAS